MPIIINDLDVVVTEPVDTSPARPDPQPSQSAVTAFDLLELADRERRRQHRLEAD